ncbi:putative ATP-dependent RNA helicase TDRD12 [Arctopsyche grandis]|uniref:putative ATP-dependent RNA helicase TDRD12 n=1 Tax=Arctopsyche grandis TaxID=121162 RepID=UPI00406D9287
MSIMDISGNMALVFDSNVWRHIVNNIKRLSQNVTSIGIPDYLIEFSQGSVYAPPSYSKTFQRMAKAPEIIEVPEKTIREAKELSHIPNLEGDVYRLYDNVFFTFGKLYLRRADKSFELFGEKISKYMINIYFSFEMSKHIQLTKNLVLSLDETTISIIKRDLKEYIEKQKMINDEFPRLNNHCNSEEEVKKMCDEILEAKDSSLSDFLLKIGQKSMFNGIPIDERLMEYKKQHCNIEKKYFERMQRLKHPPQYNVSQKFDPIEISFSEYSRDILYPNIYPITEHGYILPQSMRRRIQSGLEQPPNISKPIENNLSDIRRVSCLARNRRSNDDRSNESIHRHLAEDKTAALPISSSEECSSLSTSKSLDTFEKKKIDVIESQRQNSATGGTSKSTRVMSNPASLRSGSKYDDIFEQYSTPTLMLHSKEKLPSRWLNLNDATFTQVLHENLTLLNIKYPKSSQTATWPIITRGHDTLIIGPKDSGKTMGVLVPLCNMISNIKILGSLPKRQGPLAWIVCSNFRTAVVIEKKCNRLLEDVVIDNENISVLRIDTSLDDCTNASKLLNGCSILISTPYVVKLADLESSSLDLKRLLYLVFDGVDTLKGNYYADVLKIHKMCTEEAESRSGEGSNIQVMATSCTWNNLTDQLSKLLRNPVICIDAFNECMQYANVEIATAFTKCINRPTELVKYLNNLEEKFRRIIIICNSDNEVDKIYIRLRKCRFRAIKFLSNMGLGYINNIKYRWANHLKYSSKLALVCCETNLKYLNVTNANCLIHFSLPLSYSVFENRFSTFIDNLPPFWDKNDDVVCKVLLFIDEQDRFKLPEIVNFLKRYVVDKNDAVYKKAEAMLISSEMDKAMVAMPLCNGLMKSGKCHHDFDCTKRHMFIPEFDKSTNYLPQSGYINFKINHTHSACSYSAQILSYQNANGEEVHVEQNYPKLALDISTHYSKEENRILQTDLKPGNVCIVQLKTDQFFRCKILKIVFVKNTKYQVLIDLIDRGIHELCDSSNLLEITEDFKNIDGMAFEICVAGVMPKDRDLYWSASSKETFDGFLSSRSDDTFFSGQIILNIGNTLWLDGVLCCLPLSSRNKKHFLINVKAFILDCGIGTDNPQHIPSLYELCKKA